MNSNDEEQNANGGMSDGVNQGEEEPFYHFLRHWSTRQRGQDHSPGDQQPSNSSVVHPASNENNRPYIGGIQGDVPNSDHPSDEETLKSQSTDYFQYSETQMTTTDASADKYLTELSTDRSSLEGVGILNRADYLMGAAAAAHSPSFQEDEETGMNRPRYEKKYSGEASIFKSNDDESFSKDAYMVASGEERMDSKQPATNPDVPQKKASHVTFEETNMDDATYEHMKENDWCECSVKSKESEHSTNGGVSSSQGFTETPTLADNSHFVPGAHYVVGIAGTPEPDTIQTPTATATTTADETLVAATLVDTAQEEQRIQDLEEQNRRLRQRESNIVLAQVVNKGEIVKSLLDFRDPEFRRWRIGVTLFLLLVLGGVVAAIVVTRDRDGDPTFPPTQAPTPEPTTVRHSELSDFLAEHASFDGGLALVTQPSPQYQAVKWLANSTTVIDFEAYKQMLIQRYVLATLYFATNGNNWTESEGWLDDGDECGRWFQSGATYLSCTTDDEVKIIRLENNNLQGSLPPELALLSDSLTMISLRENELTGTLPTEIALLTGVNSFDVDINNIEGTIITEVGSMSLLTFLGMSGNVFSGTIPTELYRLTALSTLRLGGGLEGTIPTNIAVLSGLSELLLHDNYLAGPIPSEIGELTRLSQLSMWTNNLSGTIPSTVGLLRSLELLFLDDNLLVSTIPNEIQEMTSLVEVELKINELTGTIPTVFGVLPHLELLFLHQNNLNGSIPSELGAMPSIDELILNDNYLSGSIPTEFFLATTLTGLFINRNSLTGPIPNGIGNSTNLIHLSLLGNKLTGTIPSAILEMTNLQTLWLQNNSLAGPFTCPSFINDCKISCDDAENETCREL